MPGFYTLIGTVLAASTAAADEGGGFGTFLVLCFIGWILWLIFRPKKQRYVVDQTTTVHRL